MRPKFAILSMLSLIPAVAMSDDAPPPDGIWTGKGQAGYVASQGNTNAKSANAALDAARVDGAWKNALHLGGLYGDNSGIVAAERWDAGWQGNYEISKTMFGFGALRYAHDMFSGFQYQASATVGLGDKLIDTNATKLTVQLGAGFRRLRPEIIDKDPLGSGRVIARTPLDAKSDAVLSAGLNYSQALTGTTTLTDKLLVESGSSDTLISNSLALAVSISKKLSLSLGYTIQDNTKPPANQKKLDSLETINLVYAF